MPLIPSELIDEVKITNNNLPQRPKGFVGRKDDFARVLEALRSRYPLISIEGSSGIGKTSLAIQVGHACLSGCSEGGSEAVIFDYVVWISAKDRPDQRRWLDDVLNVIAVTGSFPAATQRPLEEKESLVKPFLRFNKVLLIVDNFDTIDDPALAVWLERIPYPSKIIITTRYIQRQQKAWAVVLRGLEPAESLSMLRQYSAQVGWEFDKRTRDETLLSLSVVTGGNPHAMKLALGLVRGGEVGFWPMINQLYGTGQNIDRLFEELFAQSWSRLSEQAREILLATPLFVGVSSIRRDALRAATGLPPFDFEQGLDRCVESNLLEPDKDNQRFIIHPMTRAFVRIQLDTRPEWEVEGRHRCAEYFLELIRKNVVRRAPEPRYWNALVTDGMMAIDPEWPSILEVMKWADQEGQDRLLVDLVMLLVHYMDSRFLNLERLSYVQKAVAVLEKMGRKEDEALLRIDALGWTYVEEYNLDKAYEEIWVGFDIAEKFAKEEREDLRALGLAWRARVRIEQNDSKRARELIEEALVINCRPWIKFRVNMAAGDIELKQANPTKALEYYEQAEVETNRYEGEGSGYQISPRIGLAYLGIGRLEEAEHKFTELRRFEQIAIGKLYAEYGLAMVASKRGEIQSARRLIDEVKAKLSRRTKSNLLLRLIKSQEDQLPGLV